ncbi:Catalase-peroxidase [Bienertia sinuspersici]
MSSQYILYAIKPRSGMPEFSCTFIYAFNEASGREELWQDLKDIYKGLKGPWLIMGDLNCDNGIEMYKITRKLKRVKDSIKELNKIGFCTIQANAHMAHQ